MRSTGTKILYLWQCRPLDVARCMPQACSRCTCLRLNTVDHYHATSIMPSIPISVPMPTTELCRPRLRRLQMRQCCCTWSIPVPMLSTFLLCRATLEEISDASVLLHLVDISHPNAAAQCDAVLQVRQRVQSEGVLVALLQKTCCTSTVLCSALYSMEPSFGQHLPGEGRIELTCSCLLVLVLVAFKQHCSRISALTHPTNRHLTSCWS